MCAIFLWSVFKARPKESNMFSIFARHSPRNADQGVPHVCKCLETRRKESKHAFLFLWILTPMEGTNLWFAWRQHGWTCAQLPFHVQRCGSGSPTCVQYFHEKAWICARPTTDHDLASVISEMRERVTISKKKCGPHFLFIHSVRIVL